MASAQDLRKRIRSVKNTQQITKAMKMVASARLHKAQQQAKSTKPYALALREMFHKVMEASKNFTDPLCEKREVKKLGYIIIGADKGLAGAYNSNLVKFVHAQLDDKNKEDLVLVTVGRKPTDYFKNRGYNVHASFSGSSDKPSYEQAVELLEIVRELFVSRQVDEVRIIYTNFINSLTYDVTESTILPIETTHAQPVTIVEEVEVDDFYTMDLDNEVVEEVEEEEEEEFETFDMELKDDVEYIYLPSETEILSLLLPKVIAFTMYEAMLQSAASELGSRMTAMTTASDNAGQLIDSLGLEYNRLRQAQITNEISEIIGGANALQ